MEISLFNKSQIVEKPYGACVIRHYIGFYAMQGIIMAEFGEKKAECFRHIAISGMIFVEFITTIQLLKAPFRKLLKQIVPIGKSGFFLSKIQ